MQPSIDLTKPTPDYVQQRVREFDADEKLKRDERAVALVFQQWPANSDHEQVLVKTVVLNRLYSTNIYAVQTVANHIVGLRIDERLHRGDTSLIDDIASVQIKGEDHFFLSFATKYCSWHQPEHFQMFDSNVESMLWRYEREFKFGSFRKDELRKYPRFVQIIDLFRSHFGLPDIGRKEVDKFLWIEGRKKPVTA
ncbi:MAG TPA: hypothetical protein VGW33_08240 [Terriglobia bacterium]|nr:hypothetical protein [Terriglobia bacterium]